ncbi:MAG: globin domain-containing protein [Pseudomonadota bacterium]
MTPEQVERVTRSFGRVFPFRQKLVTQFYDDLFEAAPEARALFPDDMTSQFKKLADMLHTVVTLLPNPNSLMPAVKSLGARHVGYGATEAHYALVGSCLIGALRDTTPGGLSEDELAAWQEAYDVLATAMIEAARQAA